MTQLEKWVKINRLYDESSPGWIRFKLSLDRSLLGTLFYSLYITSPPIIGLLILSSKDFYLWLLVIYIIYLQLLIFLNDRMLYPSFKAHDLMDLPINKRAGYLHYDRFKSQCEQAGIAKDCIKKLLSWYNLSHTKLYTNRAIRSIKLVLSVIVSLLLYYYLPQINLLSGHNKPLTMVLLTAVVYLFIDIIDDLSSIYKRREQKLRAFLYMLLKE